MAKQEQIDQWSKLYGRLGFSVKLINLALAICLFFSGLVFAETVILKSGKTTEGKITDGLSLKLQLTTGMLDYSDKGYMLFVPGNISSLASTPILICLPGVGVKAKQDIDNWSSIAGKMGFVVLDLDIDYTRLTSFADVDAVYVRIMNIIGSLASEYPVSKDRLYITGTSAGGMLSISLGLRYPEKFKAIGVVSGAYLRFGASEELANAKGIRFYMVHGTKDEIVPIAAFYSTKDILGENGAIIKYSIFPNDGHPVNSRGFEKVLEWISGLDTSIKH